MQKRIAELRERRRKVVRRSDMLGLPQGVVEKTLRWGPDVLETVGREGGFTGLTPHVLWKLLSGLTHGRMYASHMSLDCEVVAEAGRSVTVKFSTNEEYLYVAVLMAEHLLSLSHAAFDRDRVNPKHGRSFLRPSPRQLSSCLSAATHGSLREVELESQRPRASTWSNSQRRWLG
jgi:hypothetical protein